MENPLNNIDSKSQDPNETAEGESKSQHPNEQGEDDSRSQDLNEQAKESKPHNLNEQVEDDSKSQGPNEQAKESKSQGQNEQSEDGIKTLLGTPEQQPQEGKGSSLTHTSSSRGKNAMDWEDDLSGFLAAETNPSTRFSSLSLDNKIQDLKETAWVGSPLEIPELLSEEELPCSLWKKTRVEWKKELPSCPVAERKLSFHSCCCYSATEQLIKHSPVHLAKAPFRRGIVQKYQTPKLNRSEISSSSEGLLKQRLPGGIMRKKEFKAFAKNQSSRTTSSVSPNGSGRRSKALYNLYTTFYDEGEQFGQCLVQGAKGLSRACTILSTIKKGKVNVNKLLLTLHTLGILMTGAEMHQALKFVLIDAHGNLDFGDFLDVVSNTLPCSESDALENAQQVFRKIKNGIVAIEELEPILARLGVTLSPKIIQQALECTWITWDGKLNILDFLLIVRGPFSLQKQLYEYRTLETGSSQDFANVSELETRWRRKWNLLDKEIPPGHAHLTTFYDPGEEVLLAQLQRGGNKSQRTVGLRRPSTASSVCHTEQKNKDHQGIQWPKIQQNFGYTTQYTLFPLSSSLSFKEEDKSFVEQQKTRKLPLPVGQEAAPSSVAQISINYETLQQQQKKKKLSFQENLPRRYDNNRVSNSRTSERGGKEHSEGPSVQQALQDAFDIIQMLARDNIKESELCSILNKLGVNLNDRELQEVLQKADVALLKDVIQAIDKIEGDKVVLHDVPSFMRNMGIHLSDQEFTQALKQVSVDGNGKVVVKDFIKVLTNTPHFSELSVLKDTIKAVSNIQGNKVCLQDLKLTLKNMGIRLYSQEYKELIQTIPADREGKVDIEQVIKKIPKMQRFSEMEVLNNAIKAFSQFKDKKLKVLDVEVCLNDIGVHLTKSELMQATTSLPVSSDGSVDVKELISAMKETRRFKNYSAVLDAILALKFIKEHKKGEPIGVQRSPNTFGLHMANQVIAQVLKSVHMTETGQAKFIDFLRTLTKNQHFRTSAALADGFDILDKLENGRIGVEELQVIMKSFNISMPLNEISEALAFCNIDDSKTVNLKDFIRGVTNTSTFITSPEVQLTCMALSKLKGNHFDLRALGSTLNTMDLPEANDLLQEVMKTAQVDSYSKVNFREFIRILSLVPELPEAIVLKNTFNAMSNLKDHRIHRDDLAGTLASLGINLTSEELQMLESSVTVAGDGTVGFKDIMMSITGTQSVAEFNALQGAFSAINKICKEDIEKEDLPAALEDLGIQLSPDELQAAVASASIDGKLDGTEFLKILSNAPHFSEFIALQNATKVAENIKNEKMTVTQLEETLKSMGVHLSNTTFNEVVKSAKTNENGKIAFKDFLLALGETEDFTELEALQHALTVIGTMHGSQLHMNELQTTLHNLGLHLKHKEFQQVVHAIEVDADGTVNLKDFLMTLSKMQRFMDSVALHSAVEAFSKIKDEKVDIKEVDSMLEYLGIKLKSMEIQKALKAIPVDENGKVHFKDFLVNLMNNEHFTEPAVVHGVYNIIKLVDGDKIEVSQLKDVLAAIGITLTKEEMKEVLKNMMVDSDEKVTLKEFMKGLPNTQRFSTAVEMEGAMKTMKRIKQDKLEVEELDSIMRTMGLHLSPDEIQLALKYITMKDDGTVSMKDFMFGLTKTQRFSQAEMNRIPIKNLDSSLKNMGINLTKEEMQEALKQVTVDVDGKVNLYDIMKSLRGMQQFPQREENGKVNLNDFMMGMRTVQLIAGAEGKVIEIGDLRSTLAEKGIRLAEEDMEEALKHIIPDADGRVNLKDILGNVMLPQRPSKLEAAEDRVDIQDLDNILASAGIHLTEEELQEALKDTIVDAEGKVNLGEFMKRVQPSVQPHLQTKERITVQDLESILARKGIYLNDKELQEALMHVEVNANGTVSPSKLAKADQELQGLSSAEKRIDIDNLDAVLDEMGIHLTNKQLYEALKSAPMDADGMVDLETFKRSVNAILTSQQTGKMVNVSKLNSILAGMGLHLTQEEVQEALKQTMLNKDGTVNLKDFMWAIQGLPCFQDEQLDASNLDSVLGGMGIYLTQEELEDALKLTTLNEVGTVNLKDFIKACNDTLTLSSNDRRYQSKTLDSKMLKLPKVTEKHRPHIPGRLFSSVSPSGMVRFKTLENLSKPQLEAFHTAYDTFSKDVDGNIDILALKTTAHNLGISLTEEEAVDELVYADTDGDGKVNFTDFLNIITDSKRFIQAVAPKKGDMETVDARGILFFELMSKLVETSMLPRETTVNIVCYYRQKFLESTGKRAWRSNSIHAESKWRRSPKNGSLRKAKSTPMSAFSGAARICVMNDKELESYVEQLQATITPTDSPYSQVPVFPLIPNHDGAMKGKSKKDLHKQRRMEPISSFEDHFFHKKRWLKQEPKSSIAAKPSLTLTPELKQRRHLTFDNLDEIRREVKKATDSYQRAIAVRERNKSLKLWRRVRGGEIGLETGNPSFYQTFSTYSWSWNICQELLTPRELQEYDNKFYHSICRSSTPADKQINAGGRQKQSKN